MAGARKALIVAMDEYGDRRLATLRAPIHDAQALAEVLGDPQIGAFDVETVVNAPFHELGRAVARLFKDRRSDDLALLHFSGHGLKDDTGELYFAATDTDLDLLEATALSSSTVNRLMDRSRAGRVLLFLDCCYAGAFARGMTSRAGGAVDVNERLGGRGRAVLTASSALQFAFEGDVLEGDADVTTPSVFTSALVRGLRTGEADRDLDGWVSLDELYAYLHDEVTEANPNQTPKKWTFDIEGDLYVARRGAAITTPAELPREIRDSMSSVLTWERESAVQPLVALLRGDHAGRSLAARLALEDLAGNDDSARVRSAAAAALAPGTQDPGQVELPVRPEPHPPQPAEPAAPAEPAEPHEPHEPEADQAATATPRSQPATADPEDVSDNDDQQETTPLAPLPVPTERPPAVRTPAAGGRRRLLLALGGLLALVAAVAVGLRVWGDHDTGGAGGDAGGPLVGSSEAVVPLAPPDGPQSLVLADVYSGVTEVLVSDPDARLPTVSPDRETVAYLSNEPGVGLVPYLAPSNGLGTRPLLDEESRGRCPTTSRPSWSPDGDRLALVCTDGDRSTGLWTLEMGSSSASLVTELVHADDLEGAPSWGGDGQVYYGAADDDGDRNEIWSVPADGPGQPVRLMSDPAYSFSHPDWSQSGLLLLRTPAGRDTHGEVVVRTDDGELHPTGIGDAESPTWGPDPPNAVAQRPSADDQSRLALWTFDTSQPRASLQQVPLDGTPGVPAWGSR